MSNESIGFDQFLRRAFQLQLLRFRVCLPGKVVKYDAAKNRADVKPMLPDVYTDSSGAPRVVDVPIINHVPVMLDRGGGYSVTHPLQPGDFVTLLFADKAMDGFLMDGAQRPPEDPRTHDVNDAIAFPGLTDFGHPPPDLAADHMSLGPETPNGGPAALRIHLRPARIGLGEDNPPYSVALAETVLQELQAVRNTLAGLVTKFNGHGHAVSGSSVSGGAVTAATTSLTGGAASSPATVNPVASTTVKVKG